MLLNVQDVYKRQAAKMAAEELRTKIIAKFAEFFETDVENVEFDGVVATTKDGSKTMDIHQLAPKLLVGVKAEQLSGFATWGLSLIHI